MPLTLARAALAANTPERVLSTRAWRPFTAEVADVVCLEEASEAFVPRIHGRYAVTLVRSAAVVRCESSRSLVAAPNCVLLVPALQLYSLRAQGRANGGVVTLLVGAPDLDGLEATDRGALITDVDLVQAVETLVAQLSPAVRSLESATGMRSVLARLTSRSAASPLPGAHGASLSRVRDFLRDNPGATVTIADLAEQAGFTESHFIRAFHREFGLPPHAYHLRRRLAAASELLAGGLSVSTVAYECGFADQSHLSRKFKEVYGLTPAAWATAVAGETRRKGPAKVGAPRVSRPLARTARVMPLVTKERTWRRS
jgi:AraC-like DNA-binding protein